MSDYTPPTLVIPTPGGNPGDGSIDGALTIGASNALTSQFSWLKVGTSAAVFADVDVDGNTNFYPLVSGKALYLRGQNSTGGNYFGMSNSGIYTSGYFALYNNVSTKGLGLSPIYGLDNRTGLTAADAAAKTLYTTTGNRT